MFTKLSLTRIAAMLDHRRMSKAQQSIGGTDPSAFLTTGEFARRVHVSTATVKKLCDGGQLAHVVLSRRGDRRIPASELDRLLAEADGKRLGQR